MAFTAVPNGRSARHSHAPSHADRRSGSAYVHQAKSRPEADVDRSAATQATADRQQAEYYVRLLSQSREVIDNRIDKYERQVAIAQASGDVGNVRALRRMTVIEQRNQQVLSEMIANLDRRFRLRASGGVPDTSRRARPVVR
jgi:hypothetical protein